MGILPRVGAHVGWGGFVVDGDSVRTECDPKGLGLLVYKKERFGNCQIRVVFRSKEAKSISGDQTFSGARSCVGSRFEAVGQSLRQGWSLQTVA
jgi:hypothetical protein